MSVLERKMIHASTTCPYQCQYCFSKWLNYKRPNTITEFIDDLLIYPFCDSELEFQDYKTILFEIAEQVNLNKCRIVISISTKSYLKDDVLDELQFLHENLCKYGGGVKVSVSLTNKTFPDIEKGVASYAERIDLLKKLTNYEMKTSVIVKPILPFVSPEEYIDILDDTCSFSEKFLIGGLYVNKRTDFYKNYIQEKYETVLREVDWLDGENWLYVDSADTQKIIKNHLLAKGKAIFESDRDLIESWL